MPNSTPWERRRVFVTGATGLVGSWLVRELVKRGAGVVTLVRDWEPQSELIRSGDVNHTCVISGQLEDFAAIERAINEHAVDTVFHLGAQTIVGTALRSPLSSFEANIRGTYNLLEACRRHQDRLQAVVVASSDKAYGPSGDLPYREDMAPLGEGPYDVSKSCADLIARSYHRTYDLPVVIARCGNIFGGGDLNWSRLVPGTIRSLHCGERPVVRSDGTYTRDYVFVEDAVSAYMLMAEEIDRSDVRGEAFNFGPQQPVDVLTLVDTIARVMGRPDLPPVVEDRARAEIRDQYLSLEKTRRTLEWMPSYSLEDGLERTVEWYRSFLATREVDTNRDPAPRSPAQLSSHV